MISSKPSSDCHCPVDPLRTIVEAQEGGAILTVHVPPNASRTECAGIHGDAVKVRVAARPIDGAADHELIRSIADRCASARQQVQIQNGGVARRKRVCVKGVTAERL